MNMTYAELREWLDTLTPEQMAMPARVYAGDVDDFMPVFSVCLNTDDEMGESLDGLDPTQPLMLI